MWLRHPWRIGEVLTIHIIITHATIELGQTGNRQRQNFVRRENLLDDSPDDTGAGESLSASTKNKTSDFDTSWEFGDSELLERIAALGRRVAYGFARNQPVHAASLFEGAAVRHGVAPILNGGVQRWLHVVEKNCTTPSTVQKQNVNFAEALGAGFAIRCYDDSTMGPYVKEWLPEHAQAFDNLPKDIMRADVFRYMAVWHEGGFYADDDVVFFPGFRASIAKAEQKSSLFLGWERREKAAPSSYMWCKENIGRGLNYTEMHCEPGEPHCTMCNSLAQYIFGAKAHHPFLKDLIDHIMHLFSMDEFQVLVTHEKSSDEYVLQSTGPVTFSTQLLRYVAFKDVLDIVVFGCGQGLSDAPPCLWHNGNIWARHLFEGKLHHSTAQQSWYRKFSYMFVFAFLALWVLQFLCEKARLTGLIRREPSVIKPGSHIRETFPFGENRQHYNRQESRGTYFRKKVDGLTIDSLLKRDSRNYNPQECREILSAMANSKPRAN